MNIDSNMTDETSAKTKTRKSRSRKPKVNKARKTTAKKRGQVHARLNRVFDLSVCSVIRSAAANGKTKDDLWAFLKRKKIVVNPMTMWRQHGLGVLAKVKNKDVLTTVQLKEIGEAPAAAK